MILADSKLCTGCTACANICPNGCITMTFNAYGFCFPEIDSESCVECGACRSACPVLNRNNEHSEKTAAYAAFSNNTEIREESSSGGIFTELAAEIIKRGGVVYGAAYDESFRVFHRCAQTLEETAPLRGAKYAQSELGESFSSIRKRLKNGQSVLFSGTPCQIAGLKAFLKHDYENLFCVDLVCHGVPSPMVWEKYVRYRAASDCNGVMPQSVNLRCKSSGWSRYSYSVDFSYGNSMRYLRKNGDDPFMKLFVNDYILRESCGFCREKGYNRKSDITLGDFWGIWDIAPEMDDNRGTSLLLTHSKKGESLLKSVRDRIEIKQVSPEETSRMNPAMLHSAIHKKERKAILDSIAQGGFNPTYLPDNGQTDPVPGIRHKVKALIRKFSRKQ